MILTGDKRSSAVLAACEKRRSGLAPSTTQGHGTKTGSSIFGMPDHQTPRAASVSALAVWTVAACLLGRCGRAGTGLRPVASPLATYLAAHKTKTKLLLLIHNRCTSTSTQLGVSQVHEVSLEFCAVLLHGTSKGSCGGQCKWDGVSPSSEFSERSQVRYNIRCREEG